MAASGQCIQSDFFGIRAVERRLECELRDVKNQLQNMEKRLSSVEQRLIPVQTRLNDWNHNFWKKEGDFSQAVQEFRQGLGSTRENVAALLRQQTEDRQRILIEAERSRQLEERASLLETWCGRQDVLIRAQAAAIHALSMRLEAVEKRGTFEFNVTVRDRRNGQST